MVWEWSLVWGIAACIMSLTVVASFVVVLVSFALALLGSQDDEMHGEGECCWSSGIKMKLVFTHCYPNHVRSAVRLVCALLLLCTLLYVMPHLVDMTAPAAGSDSTTSPVRVPFGAKHCDYVVKEAPAVRCLAVLFSATHTSAPLPRASSFPSFRVSRI